MISSNSDIFKTVKKRDNLALRAGIAFFVIAVISLLAICATFAKYSVAGTGTDNARIAKWGLDISSTIDVDLFDSSYSVLPGDPATVDSSDGSNLIAPGTSKFQTITIAQSSADAPEVMYDFGIDLEIDQTRAGENPKVKEAVQSLISAGHFVLFATYKDYYIECSNRDQPESPKTIVCKTLDEWTATINSISTERVSPNNFPKAGNPTQIFFGWNWYFDASALDPTPAILDTSIGNAEAASTLGQFIVKVSPYARQVN